MNDDMVWWKAICDQFKIEFGVEVETGFGDNKIANLMYSIHALVDKAKEASRERTLNAMAEGSDRTRR